MGQYRVRFTDKNKRLNIYKKYRIQPGGVHKDRIEFVQGTLTINAPKGSVVYLNGDSLGEAPLGPIAVYQGRYLVKVSKGGRKWTKWVDAPPGGNVTYNAEIQ